MLLNRSIALLLILLPVLPLTAQDTWAGVSDKIIEVDILSSVDGSVQKAMLYKSSKPRQPLIVHLHSWSAGYQTAQPEIFPQVELRDYNYIYPHFRGPNNHPEACGSDWVIADIQDAIEYALQETGANPSEVHLVGSSGGGGTVMNCYMRLRYPAKSFSAWCSITDIESWYWEVLTRGYKNYANAILKSTSSTDTLNIAEARKRSPLFYPYPAQLREGAQLSMFAGIHDGYTADVPISQTLLMYNKVAQEKYPGNSDALVPEKDIINLLAKRCNPDAPAANIGDRKIHYHKLSGDIEVVIFEGGHDRLDDQAIGLMPVAGPVKRNPIRFLALGDHNGAAQYGWAKQLGMIFPYAQVFNFSLPGKNLGGSIDSLNALLTIEQELQSVDHYPDYIVIGFGQDKLAGDRNSIKEYTSKMQAYISKIKSSERFKGHQPELILLANFPSGHKATSQKSTLLLQELKKMASNERVVLLDVQTLLKDSQLLPTEVPGLDKITLSPRASRIIVENIAMTIEK